MRTVEQCQTRIKRLKKSFRQNKWALSDSFCVKFELSLTNVILICALFSSFTTRLNSKVECKFYAQLDQVLGSSGPSALPEVTYDVEEVIDEDESLDGDDDLQIIGQTGQMEMGIAFFKFLMPHNCCTSPALDYMTALLKSEICVFI